MLTQCSYKLTKCSEANKVLWEKRPGCCTNVYVTCHLWKESEIWRISRVTKKASWSHFSFSVASCGWLLKAPLLVCQLKRGFLLLCCLLAAVLQSQRQQVGWGQGQHRTVSGSQQSRRAVGAASTALPSWPDRPFGAALSFWSSIESGGGQVNRKWSKNNRWKKNCPACLPQLVESSSAATRS